MLIVTNDSLYLKALYERLNNKKFTGKIVRLMRD